MMSQNELKGRGICKELDGIELFVAECQLAGSVGFAGLMGSLALFLLQLMWCQFLGMMCMQCSMLPGLMMMAYVLFGTVSVLAIIGMEWREEGAWVMDMEAAAVWVLCLSMYCLGDHVQMSLFVVAVVSCGCIYTHYACYILFIVRFI